MTSTGTDSNTVFRLLEAQGAPRAAADITIRESAHAVDEGHLAHSIDAAGRRSLLIPIADADPVHDDTQSRGVTLTAKTLVDKGQEQRYLVMRCEMSLLEETFAALCDEVIEAVTATDGDAVPAAQGVIDQWRSLLAPTPSELLGVNALTGLLAELHVLEGVVRRIGARRALEAWAGPDRNRHDFVFGNRSIEVKATTNREEFSIQIHGVFQLQEPQDGELYVYAEQLERVPNGGDSVPDAIDRLAENGVRFFDVLTRLGELGYRNSDAAAYRTVRFSALETKSVRVTEAFPRIIRSSFKDPQMLAGITNVRYAVNLSQITYPTSDLLGDLASLLDSVLAGGEDVV